MSRDGSGRRDHEEFDELAVGWALKALEPDDESRFGKHLNDCSRCRQTVREAQDMTAAMALAVPLEEPSSGLRGRILAAAAASPRVADSPQPVPQLTRTSARVISRPGEETRRRRRSGSRLRQAVRGTALAAALAVVVGLGVWNIDLRNDRAGAEAVAARQAAVIDELNDRGIYRVAPLASPAGEALGMVVIHDGAAKVMADGLPVNDAERETLVLWGLRSTLSPIALGTFDVVHSQLDVRTVSSTSTGLDQYDGYAISRESGRQAPPEPTEMIATGTVGS